MFSVFTKCEEETGPEYLKKAFKGIFAQFPPFCLFPVFSLNS